MDPLRLKMLLLSPEMRRSTRKNKEGNKEHQSGAQTTSAGRRKGGGPLGETKIEIESTKVTHRQRRQQGNGSAAIHSRKKIGEKLKQHGTKAAALRIQREPQCTYWEKIQKSYSKSGDGHFGKIRQSNIRQQGSATIHYATLKSTPMKITLLRLATALAHLIYVLFFLSFILFCFILFYFSYLFLVIHNNKRTM